MFKIIVFTHGPLSTALKQSASMLNGSMEQVECFSVMPGCDLDELTGTVKSCIAQANAEGQGVLAFSDLFFGTPFNILVNLSQEVDFYHITGVNLPLLIEAVNSSRQEGMDAAAAAKDLMRLSGDTIRDTNEFLASL